METLIAFALAFFFSFVGSIPPGTLNVTMIQLGLDHKMEIAWRFAIAAAIVEYPYAWLAVEFETVITSLPFITKHLQLIAGCVMVIVGAFNLRTAEKPTRFSEKFQASGFRRGIILSILNPMALPFWIGITAYLKSVSLITLSTSAQIHAYLFGVSLGALALLILFAVIAKNLIAHLKEFSLIKKIPGILLLVLGVVAVIIYLRTNFG
jgi:threonine/homoserine/homoserine lactone efflux protein